MGFPSAAYYTACGYRVRFSQGCVSPSSYEREAILYRHRNDDGVITDFKTETKDVKAG